MQSPANPFTPRGTIRDPALFFGRRAELEHVSDRLRKMQSVSVVGERRAGRSSLLYHLYQTASERLPADLRVAYTDLPEVEGESSFYKRLCHELGARPGDEFRDLERAVRGQKAIFFLDEFDKVAGSSHFGRGFFDSLRSLAQSGQVALMLATERSLADLCRTREIATSPFWNVFTRVDLGLFPLAEAQEFVRMNFQRAGIPVSDDETDLALGQAGRFPFFLQLACWHLFESKAGQAADWPTRFERDPDVFDNLCFHWERRTLAEQSALRWVVGVGGGVPDDRLLWDLERRGLIVQDRSVPAGYRVFSPLFERVVRQPPKPVRKRRWLTPIRIREWLATVREAWKLAREIRGKGE